MSEKIEAEEAEGVKTEGTIRSMSYFAVDGNYGDADGITVMETTHWSEADWEIIESTSDEYRPDVARALTESYEPGADEKVLRAFLTDRGVDLSRWEDSSSEG